MDAPIYKNSIRLVDFKNFKQKYIFFRICPIVLEILRLFVWQNLIKMTESIVRNILLDIYISDFLHLKSSLVNLLKNKQYMVRNISLGIYSYILGSSEH